jgi:hypothetical protein
MEPYAALLDYMATQITAIVQPFATKVADKIMDASEEPSPASSQEPSEYISDLQKDLVTLVENKRNECNLDRIVVFIDDLDRLLPQKAVDFLESLKLFLDIEGCVYVLACDYQVVTQGLKQKFGVGEAELKGRSIRGRGICQTLARCHA